jgi:beta propeller repeat protein
MKSKVIFAALALIYLIGSISAASAAQVSKIGDGRDPSIYGSKVAYTDLSGYIHLYDLSTKTNTKLSSSMASLPDIYGNKMVWYDTASGVPRITIYDIPSKSKTFLTKNISEGSIPHIYGTRVVWSSDGGVYLRDISTSTQSKIADGREPDIYDTKVVYLTDTEVPDADIGATRMYDVRTKVKNTISTGDHYQPHMYGNKIIWSDFYTRSGWIQMYDISTRVTIDATSDTTGNTLPGLVGSDAGCDTGTHACIDGDKIVYSKCSSDQFGRAGIHVYNITSKQSSAVNNYPDYTCTTPEISGKNVVWGMSDDSADTGIYIATVPAKPTVEFYASKTSGTAPLSVTFTSLTSGSPTSYKWVFEPSTSSDWYSTHPVTAVHTFKKRGTYPISCTVTNSVGSATATRTSYIIVK